MKANYLPIIALASIFYSCIEENSVDPLNFNVPEIYAFERDGASTVSYQGQTDRLNILSEIKSYMSTANNGEVISSQTLMDMYANVNEPFKHADLNIATSKQLENKTNPAMLHF